MPNEVQQTEPLHVFREDNGEDFYLARDMAHALDLWVADTGLEAAEADFRALKDDEVLVLRDDDGSKDAKTCVEWAIAIGRPGGFAGANY